VGEWVNWEDKVRNTDAARGKPEAVEVLIERAGGGVRSGCNPSCSSSSIEATPSAAESEALLSRQD